MRTVGDVAGRYLLLHGAGTGGWLWDAVATLLRAGGATVLTPTLSGVGERVSDGGPDTNVTTHVAESTELLSPGDPTVVVGFSYSGLVASRLAAERPEAVARLLLVDAFLPVPGLCFLDLMPAAMAERLRRVAADEGEGWKLPPLPLAAVGGTGALEDGVDAGTVDAVLRRRGVHPLGTYLEVAEGSWLPDESFPVRYVSCTDKPDGDPVRALGLRLQAEGRDVAEIATGHFAMVTMPRRLTALITTS